MIRDLFEQNLEKCLTVFQKNIFHHLFFSNFPQHHLKYNDYQTKFTNFSYRPSINTIFNIFILYSLHKFSTAKLKQKSVRYIIVATTKKCYQSKNK